MPIEKASPPRPKKPITPSLTGSWIAVSPPAEATFGSTNKIMANKPLTMNNQTIVWTNQRRTSSHSRISLTNRLLNPNSQPAPLFLCIALSIVFS